MLAQLDQLISETTASLAEVQGDPTDEVRVQSRLETLQEVRSLLAPPPGEPVEDVDVSTVRVAAALVELAEQLMERADPEARMADTASSLKEAAEDIVHDLGRWDSLYGEDEA